MTFKLESLRDAVDLGPGWCQEGRADSAGAKCPLGKFVSDLVAAAAREQQHSHREAPCPVVTRESPGDGLTVRLAGGSECFETLAFSRFIKIHLKGQRRRKTPDSVTERRMNK